MSPLTIDPWLDLGCSKGLLERVELREGGWIVSSLNLEPGCSNGFVDLEDCLVLGTLTSSSRVSNGLLDLDDCLRGVE